MNVNDRREILYSGRGDDIHQCGETIILDKMAAASLIEENSFRDCIITARFNLHHIQTTILPAYAPAKDAKSEAKDGFTINYIGR